MGPGPLCRAFCMARCHHLHTGKGRKSWRAPKSIQKQGSLSVFFFFFWDSDLECMKQICQVQMNSSDLSYGLFLKVKCQERTERASSCGSWLTALHLAIKRRGNCNDLCSMISFSLQLLHKEWRSHTSGHSKLQDQMSGRQSNVKRTKCDKSNFVSEDGGFFPPSSPSWGHRVCLICRMMSLNFTFEVSNDSIFYC